MGRGSFRIFKVPQPLKNGQGVMLTVCDVTDRSAVTTAAPALPQENKRRRTESIDMGGECCALTTGCSEPDIYVSKVLPRTNYDFSLIAAFPNGSKEELVVYNSSSTGRYYLAVYAKESGMFLVVAKATTVPPAAALATDSIFLVLVWEWMMTTQSGTITLIVVSVLMCVLCTGCMFACCCEHESLHKHLETKPTSFGGRAAQTFSRFIGSRHPDHEHHSHHGTASGMRLNSGLSSQSMQQAPQQQSRFDAMSPRTQHTAVQMTHMNPQRQGGVPRPPGRGRKKKTVI
jgi:hypothetical protein